MHVVKESDEFSQWLNKLKDFKAVSKILMRMKHIEMGNFGDWKFIGDKIYELRIDWGKGYRVYCTKRNLVVVLLLLGGDKDSQSRDIKKAKEILKKVEENDEKENKR